MKVLFNIKYKIRDNEYGYLNNFVDISPKLNKLIDKNQERIYEYLLECDTEESKNTIDRLKTKIANFQNMVYETVDGTKYKPNQIIITGLEIIRRN